MYSYQNVNRKNNDITKCEYIMYQIYTYVCTSNVNMRSFTVLLTLNEMNMIPYGQNENSFRKLCNTDKD